MAVDFLCLMPERPPMAALGMANRLLLLSMREWLRAAIEGKPVTPALRTGLNSFGMGGMAAPMARFMDEAASAWPERLRLFPPLCGCPISYDEWLLLSCLADARRNARHSFDGRLNEMIGASSRNRMWCAAVQLAHAAGQPSLD